MLVDANAANTLDVARLKNSRHENQKTAQAIAFVEMRVGDDSTEKGDSEEIPNGDYLAIERISKRRRRVEIGAVRRIVLCRVREFAEHCEAGAGASDGNAATNRAIDGAFDWGAAPEIEFSRQTDLMYGL